MQQVLFAQCPVKDVHLIMPHAKAFFGRLKTEMYYGRKWSGITPEKFMQQVDAYIRWYNERRIKLSGFAPIFPDTCYHLTHYWLAAVDIPVASDNPVHYADAIRYNARTPLQGSLLPLTRLVWA